MKRVVSILALIFVIFTFFSLTACSPAKNRQVVVYTSVDQVFSEPLLKQFEKDTGIKVLPLYDTEATKTTGLANRIVAEKSNPRADVFWNGEFTQTIMLKEKGLLKAYNSPRAKELPPNFVDSEGYWTAFGGRARVFIINTDMLSKEEYPQSLFDMVDDRYQGSDIGLSYPVFGTSATHSAALYSFLGNEKALDFFNKIKKKGIQIVDGNSVVRDLVADGKLKFGITDTDDALSAVKKGKPVEVVIPDQGENGQGTLIIPNTVAVISGCPNPDEAKVFIDYILSAETEQYLVDAGWIDIPSRQSVKGGFYSEFKKIKGMEIDFNKVYLEMKASTKDMQEIFVR